MKDPWDGGMVGAEGVVAYRGGGDGGGGASAAVFLWHVVQGLLHGSHALGGCVTVGIQVIYIVNIDHVKNKKTI